MYRVYCETCGIGSGYAKEPQPTKVYCGVCDKEAIEWRRQTIQNNSAPEHSDSHGTLDLQKQRSQESTKILEVFNQLTVLRAMYAGISYEQSLRSALYSPDTDELPTTKQQLDDAISASFVRLQSQLFNYFTLATIAETDMILSPVDEDCNTISPGKTL